MTASISLACARSFNRIVRSGILLLLLLLAVVTSAYADKARFRNAEIVRGDVGYVLNADIDVTLNSRLIDALNRGVSLYFSTELRVERPRWYWFDKVVLERSLDYRLSYHAITRSYRLSIGSLHQSFDELDAALRTMLRIRNWQIDEKGRIKAGRSHDVALRFRLDTAQLPKPFQVTAIGSRDWNLATGWLTWTFLPGVAGQR